MAIADVSPAAADPSAPYRRMASVYDWIFGLPLQSGRIAAMRRLSIRPGDRVLEVGIGTGLNAPLYPRDCTVTGIDACAAMLRRAACRLSSHRIRHIRLLQMDAAHMRFADDAFDVVYAPYLVTAVPDPVGVGREMRRVCAPGGRIAILNHFASEHPAVSWIERRLERLGLQYGFRSNLDMEQFLEAAGLEPIFIGRVNFPPIWSLVLCGKATHARPPGGSGGIPLAERGGGGDLQ